MRRRPAKCDLELFLNEPDFSIGKYLDDLIPQLNYTMVPPKRPLVEYPLGADDVAAILDWWDEEKSS